MLQAEALTKVTTELPRSRIVIKFPDGQIAVATGFQVRDDEHGERTLVIVAGKKPVVLQEQGIAG